MRRTWVLVVAALILAVCASALAQQGGGSALPSGAWRLTEVTTTGPGGSTNRTPQPALFLFTTKHYSITRVTSNALRPDFKDPAKVTPEEALATWGPLLAQSGTYEASGGKLTTHIVVAKNPRAMTGKVTDTYSYAIEGNTMTLTTLTGIAGPIQNPTTFKLVKAE